VTPWRDPNPQAFPHTERDTTTILIGGLSEAHDRLMESSLEGWGYRARALPVADAAAFRLGREHCDRGLCNPAYFTIGNLLKHLGELRDRDGWSQQRIERELLFASAGACGPCRFGAYATQYRKALRDAGLPGFRVLNFQQQGGPHQGIGEGGALRMHPRLDLAVLGAVLAADLLNAAGHRLRPFEREAGATDHALQRCIGICQQVLGRRGSALRALRQCRRELELVALDRLRPRPRVLLIGEFWAVTTEGDGNYRMQRFLEQEGAEVEVPSVMMWLQYLLWQQRFDTRRRLGLDEPDEGRRGLKGVSPRSRLLRMWAGDRLLRAWVRLGAVALGLEDYHLPDMDALARLAQPFYDNELRGGEGHLEVAHYLSAAQARAAHLVLSLKPFGCLPSAGVSDGIQAWLARRHPDTPFCAVETTGDAEINAYSRVQLALGPAREAAVAELDALVDRHGLSLEQARRRIDAHRRLRRALHRPAGSAAGTAARAYLEALGTS
jgi:predicted nucleotide-binding protein (sugar kinase/HSP70/actin superfamily)